MKYPRDRNYVKTPEIKTFRLHGPIGSGKQRYFLVFCFLEEISLIVVRLGVVTCAFSNSIVYLYHLIYMFSSLESMYIDKFRCKTLGLNSSSILATEFMKENKVSKFLKISSSIFVSFYLFCSKFYNKIGH